MIKYITECCEEETKKIVATVELSGDYAWLCLDGVRIIGVTSATGKISRHSVTSTNLKNLGLEVSPNSSDYIRGAWE